MIHAMYGTRAGARQMFDTDRAMRPGSEWFNLIKNDWPRHAQWFEAAGVPFSIWLHNPMGHRIKGWNNGKPILDVMDLDGWIENTRWKDLRPLYRDFEKAMKDYKKETGSEICIYAGGFGTPWFRTYKQNDPDKWRKRFNDSTRPYSGCDRIFFDALSAHDQLSLEVQSVQAMESHPLQQGRIGGEAPPRRGQEGAWKNFNICVVALSGWQKWLGANAPDNQRRVGVEFTDANNREYYITPNGDIKRNMLFWQRQIRRGYHVCLIMDAIPNDMTYEMMMEGSLLEDDPT